MHTKSGKLEREKRESTVHKMPENNRPNNKKRMHCFFILFVAHTKHFVKTAVATSVDYIVAIWLVKNRQKKDRTFRTYDKQHAERTKKYEYNTLSITKYRCALRPKENSNGIFVCRIVEQKMTHTARNTPNK